MIALGLALYFAVGVGVAEVICRINERRLAAFSYISIVIAWVIMIPLAILTKADD